MYDIVLKNQSGEKSVYKSVSELNVPKDGEGTVPFSARHLARVDVNENTVDVQCSQTCAYGVDYIVAINAYGTSAITTLENARVSVMIGGEDVSSTMIKWNSGDVIDHNAVMCNTDDDRLLVIRVGGSMIVGDVVITVSV